MAIAIFSTWTTYGTWLPGDQRGWYQPGRGVQLPDRIREFDAALCMTESALILDHEQRLLVEKTIADHCAIRDWTLHAVRCRTNHVHVALTAPARAIEIPREQFKAWCTRKLDDRDRQRGGNHLALRENWWTERGWDEYIDTEEGLLEVIAYILERQDRL